MSYTDNIRQRKIEYRGRGFEESQQPCPECGCYLFERENTIRIGSDEWEEMSELERECPCCGYVADRSYDA